MRLWKFELQKFADETGIPASVCHFPPGTSKWNKIEHRLFSFISSNWRGEPLRDYETIVQLIAKTTTAKGLKVTCRLDRRKYPTGRQVSNEEMKRIKMRPNPFHGEWNYVIEPSSPQWSHATFIHLRFLTGKSARPTGHYSVSWGFGTITLSMKL